jgi:hypothetical protein
MSFTQKEPSSWEAGARAHQEPIPGQLRRKQRPSADQGEAKEGQAISLRTRQSKSEAQRCFTVRGEMQS